MCKFVIGAYVSKLGSHGGSSELETSAALLLMSPLYAEKDLKKELGEELTIWSHVTRGINIFPEMLTV